MKKISFGLLCAVMLLALLAGCGSEQSVSGSAATSGEPGTADFEVTGVASANDDVTLMVTTDFGVDDRELKLGTDYSYDLAYAFYRYNDKLLLRATYDGDYHLEDYTILDAETGEDLGRLDEDGMYQAFDLRAKYESVEVDYTGDVLLSTMEENKLYIFKLGDSPFTEDLATDEIHVVNDTEGNVVVYGEDTEISGETVQVFLAKNIGEGPDPALTGFSTFSTHYMLRYATFPDSDVMNYYEDESNVWRVSSYDGSEMIDFGFASCLYNDTDSDVTLTGEGVEPISLPAREAYGMDWTAMNGYTAVE